METPVFVEVVPLPSLRSTNLSESAPTVLARRGKYSIVLLSNYSCLDVDTQCAFQRALELHRGGKPYLLSINALMQLGNALQAVLSTLWATVPCVTSTCRLRTF